MTGSARAVRIIVQAIIVGGRSRVTGIKADGTKASKGSHRGRHDKFPPSLSELTGLGPEVERDGAIIVLGTAHDWSPSRLAALFGISEPHVYRVLSDWKSERGEDD